jgi:hypothetical protein
MPERRAVIVHASVEWVMDHRTLYLKSEPADDAPSFMLSLFTIRFDRLGPVGHLAFYRYEHDGILRLETLTDESSLPAVAAARFAPGFDHDSFLARPALQAAFDGGSDTGEAPWVIAAPGMRIEASWTNLGPPLLAYGPSPGRPESADIHSLLREANDVHVSVDRAPVAGSPYTNSVWIPWLGRPLSSCLVALGEVVIAGEGSTQRKGQS